MRNTPFSKYSNEILIIRKNEIESGKIYRSIDKREILYNISELHNTYYGRKFSDILKIGKNMSIKSEKFKKITEFSLKLNLKLTIIDSD